MRPRVGDADAAKSIAGVFADAARAATTSAVFPTIVIRSRAYF
jgi:hypothetical protein